MDIWKNYECEGQLSFNFDIPLAAYRISKPIRLIELFGGIGSQAMALRNIGANFEHYRLVEFDKYPVASYNAIHGTNFVPTDITKINGSDLGIVDTDTYEYIMTYSFPCQDLSVAGKMKGMSKGDGTRSGLLWEVERLLNEVDELPQILLMENVPQVHSKKNMVDFEKWIEFLKSKGYTNHWFDLNAKDFGVPQNRNRCFMVSILGEYDYEQPSPIPLTRVMKDVLEDEVDEKYYITSDKAKELIDKLIIGGKILTDRQTEHMKEAACVKSKELHPTLMNYRYVREVDIDNAMTITAREYKGFGTTYDCQNGVIEVNKLGGMADTQSRAEQSSLVYVRQATKEGSIPLQLDGVADLTFPTSQTRRGRVQGNGQISPTLTTENIPSVLEKWIWEIDGETYLIRIRKLTPKECWRLMGFYDEDFDKAQEVNSNTQLYKQAGNSIVVNVLEAIFKQLIGETEHERD